MGIKFANNAYSTLASGINDVATSISVQSGHGARFPAISGTDYFYCTLIDSSNNLEIVKVTARSTDTLTVTRGAESTTARAYLSGDRIELRVTAAALAEATAQATKGTAIASGGTVTIPDGVGYVHITGTTTITDIDFTTASDGRNVVVVFDGALTLTHNSTTLKLPGAANITTAANDRAWFFQDDADNVICVFYAPANGSLPGLTATVTELNKLDGVTATTTELNYIDGVTSNIQTQLDTKYDSGDIATQANQESASSTVLLVTPGRQHFHPSAAKAWAFVEGGGTPSISASYNITSITDAGTGALTVTIATDMSSANYAILATVTTVGTAGMYSCVSSSTAQAAGSFRLITRNASNISDDCTSWHTVVFGDL